MREDYVTIYHPSGLESRVLSKSVASCLRDAATTEKASETDLPQVEESESKTDTTEAY